MLPVKGDALTVCQTNSFKPLWVPNTKNIGMVLALLQV